MPAQRNSRGENARRVVDFRAKFEGIPQRYRYYGGDRRAGHGTPDQLAELKIALLLVIGTPQRGLIRM